MSEFVWTDAAVRSARGLRMDIVRPELAFTGISTDSRQIEEGYLYVALNGARFDGHDFVADAVSKGASGAVVSRQPTTQTETKLYPVDDTLIALGSLASHRREQLKAQVIAITGSSGKTTTKDLAAAALSSSKRVHSTEGNLNNRIWMPLTLLATPEDAEAVVLEVGSNEPGEISALAQVAKPDIAVVTTVGESHLEKLGSLEGVIQEKLGLFCGLAEGGLGIVGDEPPVLAEEAREVCDHIRVAGGSERADEDLRPEAADVDVFGRYEFQWRGQKVAVPLMGRHAVVDTMLALAIADLLGVSPKDAALGLASAETNPLRGEVQRIGMLTLIVDCYNANPQSVRAALDVLEGQGPAARRVAVLGTMLELGDASGRLHRKVLSDALDRSFDLIVATGAFQEAAKSVGATQGTELIKAPDWKVAYPELRERLNGDEVILLKASRGVALEGIIPLLTQDF